MVLNLILGSGLTFLISLLTIVITARLLPLEIVSAIKGQTLHATWLSTIFTFQTHSALLYLHRKKDSRYPAFFALNLTILATLAGLAFIFLSSAILDEHNINTATKLAFAGYTAINVFIQATPATFTALEKTSSLKYILTSFAVCPLLALTAYLQFNQTLETFALALFVGQCITLVCSKWRAFLFDAAKQLGTSLAQVNHFYGQFYKYAAKAAAALTIENTANNLDKLVASKLLPSVSFANYAVLCFENPINNLILNAHGISVVKRHNKGIPENSKSFLNEWQNTVSRTSTITLPSSLILAFNHEFLATLLFGERYKEASLVLGIYLSTSAIRHAPFQSILRATGQIHHNITLSTVFCITSAISCYLILQDLENWKLLGFAYAAGWASYNTVAILIISIKIKLPANKVFCTTTWISRISAISASILLSSALFEKNNAISILAASTFFAIITILTDKNIRRDILFIAERKRNWKRL